MSRQIPQRPCNRLRRKLATLTALDDSAERVQAAHERASVHKLPCSVHLCNDKSMGAWGTDAVFKNERKEQRLRTTIGKGVSQGAV